MGLVIFFVVVVFLVIFFFPVLKSFVEHYSAFRRIRARNDTRAMKTTGFALMSIVEFLLTVLLIIFVYVFTHSF